MKKTYSTSTITKCLFALLVLFSTINAQAQWTQTSGPGGGLAEILRVTPNGNFIIGSRGGIFLSSDSGQTWQGSNAGMAINLSVVCMDIVGQDIYIGANTGYSYAWYKSSDDGLSWTEIFPTTGFFVPAYLAHIGNRVMAASVNQIFYSDDQGVSWDTVSTYLLSPDSASMPNMGLITVIGNDLWVSAYDMGLCKSADSGATWMHADGGLDPGNPPTSIAEAGGSLYVTIPYSSNVFQSLNNGATWSQVTYPNTFNNANKVTSINNEIYILCEPSIYKSTDVGLTWSTFSGSVNAQYLQLANIGSVFLSSTHVFDVGLQVSLDGGSTWNISNYGFADTRVMSVYGDGSNLFASSYEYDMFISSDMGVNYTEIPTPIPGNLYWAHDITKVGNEIVQGGYNFQYHSSNNGTTWQNFNTGLPFNSTIEHFDFSGNDLYAATDNGVFKSTGFGTWTSLNNGLPSGNILNLFSVLKSGNRLFISGDSTGTNFDYYGVCYYSDDDGLTWTNFSSQFNFGPYSSGRRMFKVGNTIFLAADVPLYSSVDNGNTWNLIGNGLPVYGRINDYHYDGNRLFVVMNGGVFASADMGQNFVDITDNLPNTVVHTLTEVNGYLFIGTEWSGVWKRDNGSITVGTKPLSVVYDLITVYPNPSVSNLTIITSGGINQQLQIFSANGMLVHEEIIKSEKTNYETTQLESGLYFVQYFDGVHVRKAKFVHTR